MGLVSAWSHKRPPLLFFQVYQIPKFSLWWAAQTEHSDSFSSFFKATAWTVAVPVWDTGAVLLTYNRDPLFVLWGGKKTKIHQYDDVEVGLNSQAAIKLINISLCVFVHIKWEEMTCCQSSDEVCCGSGPAPGCSACSLTVLTHLVCLQNDASD